MGKGSKGRKRGRAGHQKQSSVQYATSPVPERFKSFEYIPPGHDRSSAQWLGHGIESLDVSVQAGGQVDERAHINRLEASALDGLMKAGVLKDPGGMSGATDPESVANRRHAAGILLREIFHDSGFESRSVGQYDKAANEMTPSGTRQPESERELDNQAEFQRLMRLCFPYHTVVRNVCCYNERPPVVVRDGRERPCHWDEALRRGLDRIVEDKYPAQGRPRRRAFVSPEAVPG